VAGLEPGWFVEFGDAAVGWEGEHGEVLFGGVCGGVVAAGAEAGRVGVTVLLPLGFGGFGFDGNSQAEADAPSQTHL
jgi:hypothetical protein